MSNNRKSLDICAFCEAPTWCYPTQKGPLCEACRVVRFFRKILFGPLGFTLLKWHEEDLRNIYGRSDPETGLRVVRRAYLERAKKNGKSFFVGGLPIYHLVMDDPEEHPEIYGCAAAKDQAAYVYRAACRLVQNNALLRDKLKILPSTRRILRRDQAGFYAVVSADGDLQDGMEPSLGIIDELHRWKTNKAHTLYDVLTRGTISRQQPLVVEITTAGDVYESPICWREHMYARQILDGSIKSDRFYASIYAADEDKIRSDPDYWKSREARVEANPSHEDLGGFLKDAELAALCKEAQEKPAEEAKYKRYHLGVWGEKADRWTPMGAWQRCAVPLRPLVDRDCWIGVDLSKTTDFCAVVAVFPADDGSLDVLPHFWVPEARIPDIERRTHQDISGWVKRGLVITTAGNVVDYESLRQRISWCRETFRVQELCYDPWNATDFIQRLVDDGLRCIEIRQGGKTLSAPMKWLLEKILNQQIRHAGHEVLTWHADCVTVKTDTNGNICPAKDRLERDGKRIDGMAALVTAAARMILMRPQTSAWMAEKIVI